MSRGPRRNRLIDRLAALGGSIVVVSATLLVAAAAASPVLAADAAASDASSTTGGLPLILLAFVGLGTTLLLLTPRRVRLVRVRRDRP